MLVHLLQNVIKPNLLNLALLRNAPKSVQANVAVYLEIVPQQLLLHPLQLRELASRLYLKIYVMGQGIVLRTHR